MSRRSFRVAAWLAATAGALLAACATAPPVQEMSDARQAIARALEADARSHAPELVAEAEQLITVAEEQIRSEAYGRARANAVRAKNRAQRAHDEAAAAGSPD